MAGVVVVNAAHCWAGMKPPLSIFAVGLMLLATHAYADEQEDTVERARASFNLGVELYKDGKFEEALGAFQKAYELKPTYRLLYNIARTHFELHDYVNCYRVLKDYVEQAGDDMSDARRAQVDDLNHKLEERIASLTIACNVPDAELRIDGVVVGRSPLTSPVLVAAGAKRISAVLPGYRTASRTITVMGAEKTTVTLELSPIVKAATSDPAPARTQPSAVEVASPSPGSAPEPARHSIGTGFIVSVTFASGCAIGAGIFGWQMLVAKDDFDREIAKSPYDRPAIEHARTRARTYEYLTWGFASAAVISGGLALYLAVSGDPPAGRGTGKRKHALLLAPTGSGLLLNGSW